MSNDIIEYELLGEDDPSLLIAMEPLWRGMADELQELHYLKGVKFVNQLKLLQHFLTCFRLMHWHQRQQVAGTGKPGRLDLSPLGITVTSDV